MPVDDAGNAGDEPGRFFRAFFRIFYKDGENIVAAIGQEDEAYVVDADDFPLGIPVTGPCLVANPGLGGQ